MTLNRGHARHPWVTRSAWLLAVAAIGTACDLSTPVGPSFPPLLPPVVSSLSDNLGSVAGGAEVRIEGADFRNSQGTIVVTFGGIQSPRAVAIGSTGILATAPAHAAGPVDVVVTNPDGQSARLANAYTYVSPDSFDPDGEWEGGAETGHLPFRFTIRNRRLMEVSCDTSGTVTFTPAPPVSNGEFSFSRDDSVVIAGRLVSPRNAIGTINLAPCTTTDWFARKL